MSAFFPSQRVQLGKLVRQSRLAAGMNQTRLAELIGCQQEKISKIEMSNEAEVENHTPASSSAV